LIGIGLSDPLMTAFILSIVALGGAIFLWGVRPVSGPLMASIALTANVLELTSNIAVTVVSAFAAACMPPTRWSASASSAKRSSSSRSRSALGDRHRRFGRRRPRDLTASSSSGGRTQRALLIDDLASTSASGRAPTGRRRAADGLSLSTTDGAIAASSASLTTLGDQAGPVGRRAPERRQQRARGVLERAHLFVRRPGPRHDRALGVAAAPR
jgi:hypothetical protein